MKPRKAQERSLPGPRKHPIKEEGPIMGKWDAGVISVNDVEIPVQVDDYNGRWSAEYAGQRLSTDTRDQLRGRLDRLTKKTRTAVEVHVVRIKPYAGYGPGNITIARGKLTGLHAGTGNVLAAWQIRGKTEREQITGWGSSGTLYVGGDTTDEALAEYNRLQKELEEIRVQRDAWVKAHEIKPKDAVQRAIEAAQGGAED